jgi:hypothetical protein
VLAINKHGVIGVYVVEEGRRRQRFVRAGRLVLLAFKGPPLPGLGNFARHLDDDVFNNRLANLAWGSWSDNARDAVQNRLAKGLPHWGMGHPVSAETRAKIRAAKLAYHAAQRAAHVSN